MRLAAATFLALCLAGCPKDPRRPVVVVDGGAVSCAEWCAHASTLGCAAALPTPRGEPCVSVCESVQTSGIVAFDLACRASAPSCAAADECERR